MPSPSLTGCMDDRANALGSAVPTPGPWQYNDPAKFQQFPGKFSGTAVYAHGRIHPWRMCEVQGPDEKTEIATARLIAAAPDLLDALITVPLPINFNSHRDYSNALVTWLSARNAAIAKATSALSQVSDSERSSNVITNEVQS